MDITIIGTGTPVPTPQRRGTSIHIEIGTDQILLDCGPGAVHGLLDAGIDPSEIESLFITHHHMDHTADFNHFVVGPWILGRRTLTVYGPDGTDDLVDGFYQAYARDIDARREVGNRDLSGLTDIEVENLMASGAVETQDWSVRVLPVDHVQALETFAIRVDEHATGHSMVFSADTTKLDQMEEFASEVEVLIHETTLAPFSGEQPPGGTPWGKFAPVSPEFRDHLERIHTSPQGAGEIAAAANVKTLVLTHFLPARDIEKAIHIASKAFGGDTMAAYDGLKISTTGIANAM